MNNIFYVSKGRIYACQDGRTEHFPSEAVEKFRRNMMDIHKRKEWKTSGQGAAFMGMQAAAMEAADIRAQVEAVCLADEENLLYAASLDDSCGIYMKETCRPDSPDRFLVRKTDMNIFHLDYEPVDKLVAVSVSDGPLERHLALCSLDKGDLEMITEGESLDIMPSFSLQNRRQLYFSSAGIYFESRRQTAHISAYALNRLDLDSGEICEIIADENYDFIHGREDEKGQLFCVRRRKQLAKGGGFSPQEIILVPLRLLKAVFSWLNFFSQRYTGESLTKRSSGYNPAKQQQKTPQEIFIEGNLVNVAKTLRENTQQGEKFPGVVPKSWELVRRGADGSFEPVKRGVLDFSFDGEGGIIYSNGRHIVRLAKDGGEERLCQAELATGLSMAGD